MLLSTARKQTLLYFSVILIGLIIIFWKYLSFSFLFIFEDIGSDTISLFYPELMDDVRTIRNEGIPFWSFAKGAGQANLSESILSPFTWIYVLLGTKYLAYGIGFVQFLKVVVIAVSSFFLFKLQGIERKAALTGACLSSFLGYVIVGSTWYGHSTNVMYMLLFLLGLELWVARRQWWLLPISALFLLGPPLFFMAEFTIVYLLLRFTLSKELQLPKIGNFFANSWKPLLTGILLGAPFLGAVVYKFIYSPRVGGSESYADDLSATGMFSMNIPEHYATTIYRFFSNDLLGTADGFRGWGNYLEAPLFYCGLVSLLLVPQIFKFINRKQKIVVGSILAFWLLILIFPYFRYAFYLFMGDYYKGALSLFIPFTLLYLAVLVLDRMFRGAKINLLLLLATAGVLIALLFSSGLISKNIILKSDTRTMVLSFLLIHTLLLSIIRLAKKRNLWAAILMLAIAVEGTLFSIPALNNRKAIASERMENRELYQDYALESIAYIRSIEDGFYRVEKNFGSYMTGLNDSQAQGFFDTKSYRSHNHKNYINFYIAMDMMQPGQEHISRWLPGVMIAPELHPFFQIKYIIAKPGSDREMLNRYYDDIGELKGLNVHKNKHFIPLGFAVSDYITESEFNQLGSYFIKLNAMYNTVVIPDDEVSRYPGLIKKESTRIANALSLSSLSEKYTEKSLNITSFKQSRIKGDISLNEPSMLVFSFPYDVGWKAYVNGSKEDLSKIDHGMTGLYLESGNHEVVLKYRPPFFGIGVMLFAMGLAALIFFGIVRRPASPTPLLQPIRLKDIRVKEKEIPKANIDLQKKRVRKTKRKNSKKTKGKKKS